jgi:hypothetical protein
MKRVGMTRRRMANSRLTGARFESPEEVVRWHGAMQAQDYGPTKWSVGQRGTNFIDPDVDRALESGSIVRTHVLRPTWHFLVPDDIRWLLALTGPRVQQRNARRYRELGLVAGIRSRGEGVITSALEGGNRLTRHEIARSLEEGGIDPSGQRLSYLLLHCELEAVICSGGFVGKQHTYALLDERVPQSPRFDRDEALVELTRRYLASHGPATIKDLNWWSGLTMADIRRALSMLASEVAREVMDGLTFWSLGPEAEQASAVRNAYLLPVYDELIIGYTESRFFADPRAALARAAWTDRSLPSGVVLIDGGVAGHFKRRVEKDRIAVEIVLYGEAKPRYIRAAERAAEDLGRFTDRVVTVEVRQL